MKITLDDLINWAPFGALCVFISAGLVLIGFLIYDYVTPDDYINGRPVEFVEVCLSGHLQVSPMPYTYSDGTNTVISATLVTTYVCDHSRIDTVYLDQ